MKTGQHTSWKKELTDVIRQRMITAGAGAKERMAGQKTLKKRSDVLYKFFNDLKELGYGVRPKNIKRKHIEVVMQKWEAEEKAPATLQNNLSILRQYCHAIGKPGLIDADKSPVVDPNSTRRQGTATKDKSWSTNGVDIQTVIDQLEQFDHRIGMMVRLIQAFGLRKLEAICFRPHIVIADIAGDYIVGVESLEERDQIRSVLQAERIGIKQGTKGGRYRAIPIMTDAQRQVLEASKGLAKNLTDHIGHPGKTLVQVENIFKYAMRKHGITKKALGVTIHGLRHEYANDLLEMMSGSKTPIRGGDWTQLQKDQEKREALRMAREIAARALGHGRITITSAYCGSNKGLLNERISTLAQSIETLTQALRDIEEMLPDIYLTGIRATGMKGDWPWELATDVELPFERIRPLEKQLGLILQGIVYLRTEDIIGPNHIYIPIKDDGPGSACANARLSIRTMGKGTQNIVETL